MGSDILLIKSNSLWSLRDPTIVWRLSCGCPNVSCTKRRSDNTLIYCTRNKYTKLLYKY